MLTGFKDDADDQSGWLAGLALWACGAIAGLLVAVASRAPALSHQEVIVIGLFVSAVSVCLRLPVLLCDRPFPTALGHALWLLGVFAQLNWGGFLAMRASSGGVAAEALCICIVTEAWFASVMFRHKKLIWLSELKQIWLREFRGQSDLQARDATTGRWVEEPDIGTTGVEFTNAPADFRRLTRDAVDEHGERCLSGTVRFDMVANQRTETIVISFYPPLDGPAEVELETDSEELTARAESTTQSGARVVVRRQNATQAGTYALEWFAKASLNTALGKLSGLP